jgi:hypothetical protein
MLEIDMKLLWPEKALRPSVCFGLLSSDFVEVAPYSVLAVNSTLLNK